MSSTLVEQVRAAMVSARKNRQGDRTLLFSTLLSDIGNREIEAGRPLEDADVVEVVRRAIKRRGESVEQFRAAGRTEMADREAAEIAMLEPLLPAAVPDDEIRTAVREALAAGRRDLGAVMGAVMPRFKGRADGKQVNRIVREELASGA